MKPFLNKDINFEMFIEMLTNKVDKQRVELGCKEFENIDFVKYGIP